MRQSPLRSLFVSIAAASLCLAIGACGGAERSTTSASATTTSATSTSPAASNDGSFSAAGATGTRRHLNDGDHEHSTDEDQDNHYVGEPDSDNDYREDHLKTQNHSYVDEDDRSIVGFGHTAGAADERAIAALVARYAAASVAGDSAGACSMLLRSFAGALPEAYGQSSGPSYLRGGKTCQAVMSKFFQHEHSQLSDHFEVTGVRVSGKQAYALLGSSTNPASEIPLQHERSGWKIAGLLIVPLP